jgi:TatD DNase family protein
MTVTRLVDTHCHLDFDWYAADLDNVLARAAEAGLGRIIVPGIDLQSSQAAIELAEECTMILAAVGVHPNSSADWRDDWLDDVRQLARHEKVVAIGEIGLDYYRDHSPRNVQQEAFEAQLSLAAELNLPAIVHNREADEDVLLRLRHSVGLVGAAGGVLHSFSGPWSTATAALEIGYYLGFTGPITFKKADDLRDVAARVPIDRLLVETDGPFLAPQPYRGKRNEPAYVSYVARRLAEVRGMTEAEIARQTSANAAALFGDKVALPNDA